MITLPRRLGIGAAGRIGVRMTTAESHHMLLVHEHPSGAQEWACPTCGRRFVAQWMPTIKRLILDAGDEAVIHSGGMMDVSIATGPAIVSAPTEEDPAEAVDLDQRWHEWLQSLDFGDDDPDHPEEP